MTVDELQKVSEGLGWIAGRLLDCPDYKPEAVTAGTYCSIARLIVDELAVHLVRGVEPYEALTKTARGELLLTASQSTLMKILAANPKG